MTTHAARVTLIVTAALAAACSRAPDAESKVEAAAGRGGARDVAGPSSTGSESPPPAFAEVGASIGLDFRHASGHATRYFNPEIMGGGVALLDMDDDGDLDVYALQGGALDPAAPAPGPNRLFANRGDGTFTDVTVGSGADDRGFGMGAATGDYDGDGDLDLYVTNVGRNALLRNDGGGRFTDVTDAAGVPGTGWSTSAGFADLDGDGDLDLFVCNYLAWSAEEEYDCREVTGALDYCSPQAYERPTIDTLYRNEGDGTFRDVTQESGIGRARGNGLGVAFGDLDADGTIDIFVANDGTPNHLWLGDGNGRFAEVALERGCAMDEAGAVKAGMGVGVADLDDDGALDLLVVNLAGETDSLFVNDGAGWFMERAARAGLAGRSRPFTRFGAGFLDFDNDGVLDLYQACGRVRRMGRQYGDDRYAEPNLLFRGTEAARFEEVAPRGGTAELLAHRSRGAAFGDLDGDGGVDIVVVNADGPLYALRNVAERGRWIAFRVRERHGGDALGATLRIEAGERTVHRTVQTAYSYCAASDPRVHLGLGRLDGVERVTVRWTDGAESSFGPFAADAVVELRRAD